MKKIVFFILSFCIPQQYITAQWQVLSDGHPVNTMDFINDSIGWTAGDNGYLSKTVDGGKTWTIIPIHEKCNFNSIDFINDTLGWASCGSSLLKSVDGGLNWDAKLNVAITALQAIKDTIMYAIADSAIIYKTTDGGISFRDVSPVPHNVLGHIKFFDPYKGFVIDKYGDYWDIMITYNGGLTWGKKSRLNLPYPENVQFINDDTVYFSSGGIIYKTTNTFTTWSPKINPAGCAFHFFDRNQVITVDNTGISKSYDGGLTWPVKMDISLRMYVIPPRSGKQPSYFFYCPDENNCYMTDGGLLMKISDKGNSYRIQKIMHSLYDVCFVDKNKGFVVGGDYSGHFTYGGNAYITHDGGKTWESKISYMPSGSLTIPSSCVFVNDSMGFVISFSNNPFYQTFDGGNTWVENQLMFNKMFFVDKQIGYATTWDTIYKTTNGGKSWIQGFAIPFAHYINSFYFTDEKTGWVVSECGLIFKTTNLVTWDAVSSGTDLPLNKVFFANNTTGWIAGGYINGKDDFHPVLLKTENGGDSWFKIEKVNYLIHDLFFRNTQEGWAVGEDNNGKGILIETVNGGKNWTVQVDSLNAPLNTIHFKDGFGWAVGDIGLILRTIDSTYTSIDEHSITDISNIKLLQNYPNPFRSKTVISYQLSVVSSVELSVCDLMGRKVTTLVNEKVPAGNFEVEWNAEGIKPGIYYCELKAGQSRKVMKMILLK
jgi:photosystem II stability/assembly factor-like uncharacterized protein